MSGQTVESAIQSAREHLAAGRHADAQAVCEAVLRDRPDHADALHLLGVIALSAGRVEEAITHLRRSVAGRPDAPEFHNNLGEALRRAGRREEAIESYRRAIGLRGDYPQAWHNLALALLEGGDAGGAADAAARATAAHPRYARAFYTLGLALDEQGKLADARAALQRALELKPDYRHATMALGHVLRRQGDIPAAAELFRTLATSDRTDVSAIGCLGDCLLELRRPDDAEQAFLAARKLNPDNAEINHRLAALWEMQGRAQEAVEQFALVHRRFGRDVAQLRAATLLPVIYQSAEEVAQWRARLRDQLAALSRDGFRLDITNARVPPLFYVPYQGLDDDREIQRAYAGLVAPPPPIELTAAPSGRRVRVGFLSDYFRFHTIGQINRGLIANLSREQFEVIVLSPGGRWDDGIARFIAEHADAWVNLPTDLPAARHAIAEQKLDVLFYTDLGMDDFTYTLAFSRLAPHQCVTWGHPCTSGVATIDDYVSSELLESPEADAHYTERLVRLKNLSVYYYRPTLTSPQKTLRDFGFEDNQHVYGCPQSLYKIHPDFDFILDEILRRDDRGVVVLPRGNSRHWERLLRQRFARTMPAAHQRVRFVPTMSYDDYLAFSAACPVLLAPIHFGAGNTSYEAFAFGTPTVTLPSPYLKGRITYGLYRAMGVMDCVAETPAQYAEIAVRLGTDRDFAMAMREKILGSNSVLYENPAGVRNLESYLTSVARR
jgi:predicted O-linked N-acetylglucosamine transferase (SPINDLY family)